MLPTNITPKTRHCLYDHIENSGNKIKEGEELSLQGAQYQRNPTSQQRGKHRHSLRDKLRAIKHRPKRIMRKCLVKSRRSSQERNGGEDGDSEYFEDDLGEAVNEQCNDFMVGYKAEEERFADQNSSANFTNTNKLLMRFSGVHGNAEYILPVPEGHKLHYKLVRRNEGLKVLHPQFQLVDEQRQSILFCKKVSMFSFAFSLKSGHWDEQDDSFIGSLQSNLAGSLLNFYLKTHKHRRLLYSIEFTNGFLQFKKPRAIKAYLLDLTRSDSDSQSNQVKSLRELYLKDARERVVFLENRLPVYNKRDKIWSLDFHGRAPVCSVKNFILQRPAFKGREYLLFGKAGAQQFNLDFMHPLSPLCAFALGVSSFNGKVVCE